MIGPGAEATADIQDWKELLTNEVSHEFGEITRLD